MFEKMKQTSAFQKIVILLFFLTVFTTVLSLLMFTVDRPYIEYSRCGQVITNQMTLNATGCVITHPMRYPSALMDNIINLNIVVGIAFLLSASVLYFNNKKRCGKE